MKPSIRSKLEKLSERIDEINGLLAQPSVIGEQSRFRTLSKEYAELTPVVNSFKDYLRVLAEIVSMQSMLKDNDAELREMARGELLRAEQQQAEYERKLQALLLPTDPNDSRNIFLEVRAGTGGDEAAIFAGNLFRMYARYAERRGWKMEILSESTGEHGGYREVIAKIIGAGAYSRLKFESGTHRVQRVPETEAQGRVHTSACTVAILPEPDEVEEVDINPADLRVDTYRSSGAGGQHVNKTDSAIRLTHLPTGIVVECQDERSQHKNRSRAMSLLQAKLLAADQEKQRSEIAQSRKLQVGSGDRSERIRTYNFPQGRVTDHRVNVTLYKINAIIEGDLDAVIDPLITEYQTEQLAALSENDR